MSIYYLEKKEVMKNLRQLEDFIDLQNKSKKPTQEDLNHYLTIKYDYHRLQYIVKNNFWHYIAINHKFSFDPRSLALLSNILDEEFAKEADLPKGFNLERDLTDELKISKADLLRNREMKEVYWLQQLNIKINPQVFYRDIFPNDFKELTDTISDRYFKALVKFLWRTETKLVNPLIYASEIISGLPNEIVSVVYNHSIYNLKKINVIKFIPLIIQVREDAFQILQQFSCFKDNLKLVDNIHVFDSGYFRIKCNDVNDNFKPVEITIIYNKFDLVNVKEFQFVHGSFLWKVKRVWDQLTY